MTNTKEQVLEMVSTGKISAAEGDALLGAMQTPARSAWQILANPFERLGTAQALLLGAAGALGGVGLSRWNVRFDGALDVHVGPKAVSLATAGLDLLVAWPLTSLVLWTAAWARARQARAVDFLGSVGVARLPLLAMGVAAAAMKDQLPSDPSQLASVSPTPVLILVAITIPAVIWMVTLLFQGFRTASGLQGTPGKVTFALAVVAAEVLSKLVLFLAR